MSQNNRICPYYAKTTNEWTGNIPSHNPIFWTWPHWLTPKHFWPFPVGDKTDDAQWCCGKGLRGIIRPFPKFWSYSVETVDKVFKWRDATYFVSKLPDLQVPGSQKLIRLPAGACTEKIASTCRKYIIYIAPYDLPHWHNIGLRLLRESFNTR